MTDGADVIADGCCKRMAMEKHLCWHTVIKDAIESVRAEAEGKKIFGCTVGLCNACDDLMAQRGKYIGAIEYLLLTRGIKCESPQCSETYTDPSCAYHRALKVLSMPIPFAGKGGQG